MTMLAQASAGRRFSRLIVRRRPEGGSAVASPRPMPLVVLALAVAADYAEHVVVQGPCSAAPADAASLAAADAIARQPSRAGESDVEGLAGQVAAAVFVRRAPRGAAGAPTVATRSRAAAVTASVGYAGVAPSNFGSALGYDAISVEASATSLARLADSRLTAGR